MTINLICVGKIKEKYLKDACNEYIKRLSRFSKINVIEIPDEKDDDPEGKKTEGNRILNKIQQNDYVIALEIKGKEYSSLEFAENLNNILIGGKSTIDYIIGGSNGLHEDVLRISDLRLSFSKMTFPHQLMRVILLEQIYRAFKINNGETYHK